VLDISPGLPPPSHFKLKFTIACINDTTGDLVTSKHQDHVAYFSRQSTSRNKEYATHFYSIGCIESSYTIGGANRQFVDSKVDKQAFVTKEAQQISSDMAGEDTHFVSMYDGQIKIFRFGDD
jgi:hypothetical protein